MHTREALPVHQLFNRCQGCAGCFLLQSTGPPTSKSQEKAHFMDEDTEEEMRDLTCVGSLGQHTTWLRLGPKPVLFIPKPSLQDDPWPWKPPLPTAIPAPASRGVAIAPGFWNVLQCSVWLLRGVRLVCWASHNVPLPAFVAQKQ